jgi:two-component system, NarL family, nitrate/nitrite response regulator NarL
MLDGKPEPGIRLLIADDTRLHTSLLADALRRSGVFEVIGSDSQDLLGRADLHETDVVLLNSELDGIPGRGFEVLRAIRERQPAVRAIMLIDSGSESVVASFRAGARGVLSRHETIETVSKCVCSVHQGQVWANSEQMTLMLQALTSSQNPQSVYSGRFEHLSKREIEIVECVGQGWSNRKIAERLGLSQHTVKNYIFKVFDKLGVSSRVELLSMTMSWTGPSQPNQKSSRMSEARYSRLDESQLEECRKAAEQGNSNAQVDLAAFHWSRRIDRGDLTQAYKWYLVAGEQIARARKRVAASMTMDQRLEAEDMAAAWLKKPYGPPASSLKDPFSVQPRKELASAGDRRVKQRSGT